MNIQILIVIVIIIGGAGWLFNHQIESRIVAEQAAQAERTRADLSEKQIQRLETALENERERQEQLTAELQQARDLEAKTTEVLEDRKRLETLTAAKPKLIEKLARKATTKVWSELEGVTRE